MLVCFSHCCRAILSHRHTPSSLPTAELSGQDALQEELHWKSEWFKIHTLSYVSTAFPGPRSAILPHRNFTDMPLHTHNTHSSEFIQSNLHYCHRAATLWPGKFRLLHVKKSPIVYPKPGSHLCRLAVRQSHLSFWGILMGFGIRRWGSITR